MYLRKQKFHFYYFIDNLDYYGNSDKLEQLVNGLSEMPVVQSSSVDFWLSGFTMWLNSTPNLNISGERNKGNVC